MKSAAHAQAIRLLVALALGACGQSHEPPTPDAVCLATVFGAFDRTHLLITPESAPDTCIHIAVRHGGDGPAWEGIEVTPGSTVELIQWWSLACGDPLSSGDLIAPIAASGRLEVRPLSETSTSAVEVDADLVLEGEGGGRSLDSVLRTGWIRATPAGCPPYF
jgi:hypothetical protein